MNRIIIIISFNFWLFQFWGLIGGMLGSVQVAKVLTKMNKDKSVIIAINICVRGVKLMNGLSGRRMINYFFVAVNVWRIKWLRL